MYSGNIAGIGRNDASSLNQLQSKSATYSGDISVQFVGALMDNQILTWANDGGATGARTNSNVIS